MGLGTPVATLYAPRDFDISPYFEVVKPTILNGFDYKAMQWSDLASAPLLGEPQPAPAPDRETLAPAA